MKRLFAINAILFVALAAHCAPLATENFVTNKIAAAISQIPPPDFSTNNVALVETIEATAPAPGDYEIVSNKAMTAVQPGSLSFTNDYIRTSWADDKTSEFAGHANEASYADSASTAEWATYADRAGISDFSDYAQKIQFGANLSDAKSGEEMLALNKNYTDNATSNLARVAHTGSYIDLSNKPTIPTVPTAQINAATTTNALQDTAIESNRVSIASHADSISTLSDSISTLSNTTSTVSSGLAQLADEVAPAVNGYARLYSFVTGSTNANFVVTNYQLTAEAQASRTHFDPSDPDLDFSTVPPSLRLEDASSGTNRVVVDTRDWVVWYYAQKIGGAMAEAVSTAVDTCRAWCGFTASGLENPAPDTLVVDVPNIWLMAGKTFEKHIAGSNAVWIIRSSGVVMPISDNSQSAGGFLELTDAFGTPYIRFKKTESYFVDPAADGVEYDSATGAWLVTYTTTTCPKGGANAVLEGSTTYPGKAILKDEDDPDCPATITWTGSANNWVMHAVPKQIDGAVPPKMFFAAVVEAQGQDYIEYLRPMSVPSLMFNGATYAPTVNGNKLEFIAQ